MVYLFYVLVAITMVICIYVLYLTIKEGDELMIRKVSSNSDQKSNEPADKNKIEKPTRTG